MDGLSRVDILRDYSWDQGMDSIKEKHKKRMMELELVMKDQENAAVYDSTVFVSHSIAVMKPTAESARTEATDRLLISRLGSTAIGRGIASVSHSIPN